MGSLPDVSSSEIRAALLRLEGRRKEGEALDCWREAFDAVAAAWLNAQGTLSDDDLRNRIPEAIMEPAVEFGWIKYPPCRAVRRERHNPGFWGRIYWDPVQIPEEELTEQFGKFKVHAGFRESLQKHLAGRIDMWQAATLERTKKPPSSPARSRRGRKKGGSRETADLDDAIRQAKKEGYKATVDIIRCLIRYPLPVPLPFGWREKYGLKNWQMVDAKCQHDKKLLELVRKRFSKVKA
jgi:hypothetical protein